MKKLLKAVGILLFTGLAVVFLDIGCVFRYTLGVPCLGCGTTRACIQFLQGHLVEAFYWHPLFWFTVPLLFLTLIKQQTVFRSKKANRTFWIIIGLMYFSVYLVRMLMLFPDIPPMDYNYNSLLYRIFEMVQTHFAT